jgi:hypothetical protein
MNFFEWLWRQLQQLIEIIKNLFRNLPDIYGESTVKREGEGANSIDITFSSKRSIQLVKATWDWNEANKNVWLDRDGGPMGAPENRGVDSYEFHFGDAAPDVDTRVFGFSATGFDSGDYFKFIMDLDLNQGPGSTGTPLTDDYRGGILTVEFSDGTVLSTEFNTPVDEPWGAKAVFQKK